MRVRGVTVWSAAPAPMRDRGRSRPQAGGRGIGVDRRAVGPGIDQRAHRIGIGETPRGDGVAAADADADPALLVDHGEGLLVGEVVAQKHRAAAGIGRRLGQGADGMALGRGSRDDLTDRLAQLQPIGVTEIGRGRLHGLLRLRGVGGRGEAPMHRDGSALVLDQHGFEVAHGVLQPCDAGAQGRMILGAPSRHHPVDPPLDPVQPGDIESGGREEVVDHRDGAAGDDGERPAEPVPQAQERWRELRGHHHLVGSGSDLHEGAVEIEKEGEIRHRHCPRVSGSGWPAHRDGRSIGAAEFLSSASRAGLAWPAPRANAASRISPACRPPSRKRSPVSGRVFSR